MAIGMRMGRSDPKDKEAIAKIYRKCQEFWKQFEKEFGSCYCYDLINCHLDNEEQRQRWLASGGMGKCASIVEKTARMLCDSLYDNK